MTNIAHNMKHLRRIRGISQKKLAELSGVSHATIQKLEQGQQNNPTMKVVRKISAALGVVVFELLEEPFPLPNARFEWDDEYQ